MVPLGVDGAAAGRPGAGEPRIGRAGACEPRVGAPGAAELLVGPGLESGRVGGIEPPGVVRPAVRPRIGGGPPDITGLGVARPRLGSRGPEAGRLLMLGDVVRKPGGGRLEVG